MPPLRNDNVLPADFDGIFRFTNPTDREFKCRWNNIEYSFAAMSTSPLIIPNETPEGVQHIRKKFAKELAEREFYLSGKFTALNDTAPAGSGKTPAIYSEEDLAPYVQKCLEPLPLKNATAAQMPRQTADNLRKDDNGKNVTRPLDKNESLLAQGSGAID